MRVGAMIDRVKTSTELTLAADKDRKVFPAGSSASTQKSGVIVFDTRQESTLRL